MGQKSRRYTGEGKGSARQCKWLLMWKEGFGENRIGVANRNVAIINAIIQLDAPQLCHAGCESCSISRRVHPRETEVCSDMSYVCSIVYRRVRTIVQVAETGKLPFDWWHFASNSSHRKPRGQTKNSKQNCIPRQSSRIGLISYVRTATALSWK